VSGATTRKIGRYEVTAELGRGGMGVVYLARQPDVDRVVVLKTIRRDLDADEAEQEERFVREAQAAAALHHPNVVGVYDAFKWRGGRYIAQEYVDGVDGERALERTGPFPPRLAALIVLEIVRGLEEIHARGLVHRDLKPDNLLLGRRGEAKIADFGIALDLKSRSLTRTGVSMGTPTYMSPEQLMGAKLDCRSDIFAVGVVLYELLTGELPFGTADAEEAPLTARIEAGRFPSVRKRAPGTPRGLVRIMKRCLRAQPKHRYPETAALRRALERQLGAPSPADCRIEISDELSFLGAFPAKKKRTVRKTRPPEPEASSRPRGWLLAALAASILLAAATITPETRAVLRNSALQARTLGSPVLETLVNRIEVARTTPSSADPDAAAVEPSRAWWPQTNESSASETTRR
jgi:serine/threonine-protein kinase